MQEIPTDQIVTEIEPIAHEFGRMYDVIDISGGLIICSLLLQRHILISLFTWISQMELLHFWAHLIYALDTGPEFFLSLIPQKVLVMSFSVGQAFSLTGVSLVPNLCLTVQKR